MIDLGLLHLFLGIQVLQIDNNIFIYQPKYVLNLLDKLNMEDYQACATPY